MSDEKGYSLIHAIVHGNVLGAVIAPRGTETIPKSQRLFVWRVLLKPLLEEVAEHEPFPEQDAERVARELFEFCVAEGLAVSRHREPMPFQARMPGPLP